VNVKARWVLAAAAGSSLKRYTESLKIKAGENKGDVVAHEP